MLCWGGLEKIGLTDRVRNEEVLHRVKEERNILHEIRKRKVNWIGHIWSGKCFLKQVIDGTIQRRIEIKFYSHQLMHFFIQLCISLLSYIKIT